jgi:glycosyltransferase involved in cell wall biosynthesis
VPEKNIAFLLEAFALYRRRARAPRRLVLVGGGPLEAELRARIAALELSEAVEITGFVGAAEVARRLANARALLLPSRREPWGLVVNEALAFALPVAVSAAVGAGDVLVRHGGNGFVLAADDAEAWAAAMLALDEDEARWRAMSDVSRELAPAGDAERFAEGVEALAGL